MTVGFNLVIENLFFSSLPRGETQKIVAMFQSRNRESFLFKLRTARIFMSWCSICFNLVIENLFFSRLMEKIEANAQIEFQSRNRESFLFKIERY